MEDVIRNTLLRVVNTISGCYGNMGNLREIENSTILEGNVENLPEEKENMERKKSVTEIEEWAGLIQLLIEVGNLISNSLGKYENGERFGKWNIRSL